MLITQAALRSRVRGFSLVELMVALVVGLIVVGAVLALVIAITTSNRQTLQSTRLNQEMRATLAVIANDLRRARSVTDPFSTAVLVTGNPYKAVSTSVGSCVIYAYDGAVDGPWHVISLISGKVVMQGAATRPADCSVGGTPVPLGSNQVEVTSLTFTPATTASNPPLATDEGVVRTFTVTIVGRLIDQDAELSSVSRTMSQDVYVRSVGAGI
jgi:type II secretory pathway component PulJ